MNGSQRSRGLTLVEVLVVIAIIGLLAAILIPAVQAAREAARRLQCVNNLKQIALAVHNCSDTRGSLPPGVDDPDMYYGYIAPRTWFLHILPFLEQESLHDLLEAQMHPATFEATWSAEHPVVSTYKCPSAGPASFTWTDEYGTTLTNSITHYRGVPGDVYWNHSGVLFTGSRIRLTDIQDGTSQTLLAGEVATITNTDNYEGNPLEPVHIGLWVAGGMGFPEPTNIDVISGSPHVVLGVAESVPDPSMFYFHPDCSQGPYKFQRGNPKSQCSALHYWSHHPEGANFVFADGHVQFMTYSAAHLLPALATRSGGEVTASLP